MAAGAVSPCYLYRIYGVLPPWSSGSVRFHHEDTKNTKKSLFVRFVSHNLRFKQIASVT